jgi:hypothetical protein
VCVPEKNEEDEKKRGTVQLRSSRSRLSAACTGRS